MQRITRWHQRAASLLLLTTGLACGPSVEQASWQSERLSRTDDRSVALVFDQQPGAGAVSIQIVYTLDPAQLMLLESEGRPVDVQARWIATAPSGERREDARFMPILAIIPSDSSVGGARARLGPAGEAIGNGFYQVESEPMGRLAAEPGTWRLEIELDTMSAEARRGLIGVRDLGVRLMGRGDPERIGPLNPAEPTP